MTDLRFAFRQLHKSPGFTAVAVLALALGIGANTAIFTVLNSVLLRPLPYPESQELVTLFDSSPSRNIAESKMSPAKFAELRAAQKSFAAMGAYFFENLNLPSGDHAESIQVAKVYGAFFQALGREPLLGRVLQKSDDDFGAEPVAVLSYSLWRDHFGSDPQMIGRRIELSREPHTVVGVMPPGFDFPDATALWATAGFDQSLFNNPGSRMARMLTPIARLAPGASLAQAQAEAATIAARIGQRNPRSDGAWTVQLVSLYAQTVGHARLGLLVLAGAVGLVLLIACFNVANLQLARAEARQHEIAVRTALGASRARLVRQFLTESLLLAAIGAALGTLLAFWGVDLLGRLSAGEIPRAEELQPDAFVFLFTLGLTLATALLSGLAAALSGARSDAETALKESGTRTSGSVRSNRVRTALLVSQIAVALVLLVSAALLVESLVRLQKVDPGFAREHLLTFRMALPWERAGESAQFSKRIVERLEELPGVEAAASSALLPVNLPESPMAFSIEGDARPATERSLADFNVVSPDYFRVLGIPLRQGRVFTERDTGAAPGSVIVNESFARRFFPHEKPIGRRLRFEGRLAGNAPREIVGVVGSVRHHGLENAPTPEVYFSARDVLWPYLAFSVRTKAAPAAFEQLIRRSLYALDPSQPVFDFKTMDERLDDSVAQRRFNMILLGSFAAIALLLAAIGVYGVISFSVAQRRREIGIRLALGAQRSGVLRLVLRQGLMITAVGLGMGILLSLGAGRLLSHLLFQVNAHNPFIFVCTGAILSAIALLASWLPARRAARVDPLVALRSQ